MNVASDPLAWADPPKRPQKAAFVPWDVNSAAMRSSSSTGTPQMAAYSSTVRSSTDSFNRENAERTRTPLTSPS